MSRGYHLGYPKKLVLSGSILSMTYDNSRFIIVSTADNKIHFIEWFAIPSESNGLKPEEEWNMSIFRTLNLDVSLKNIIYHKGYIWGVTTDTFKEIIKINVENGEKSVIKLPLNMRSNLVISNNHILMVSAIVKNDGPDNQRMYRVNLDSAAINYTILPGKKTKAKAYIWENGYRSATAHTGRIYISLWTNFSFGVLSASTFEYETTIELNGFPSIGYYTDLNNWWVASYGGMLSLVDGQTLTVSNEYSTGDRAIALAFEHNTNNIWFVASGGILGRLTTTDTSVIDTATTSVDEDFYILPAANSESISNTQYNKAPYSDFPDKGFTDLLSTPLFNITYINSSNQEAQKTIYSRIFAAAGTTLCSFNSNNVEFVYDRPAEYLSFVSTTGSAMVGSGDTDYIGEFI